MKTRIALTVCLLAGGIGGGVGSASAADIVVQPRLVVQPAPVVVLRPALVVVEPVVPRVRPESRLKQYPFGLLREDYTPYGMAGVPARLYFTARERDLR
jgi:hypothetical protein